MMCFPCSPGGDLLEENEVRIVSCGSLQRAQFGFSEEFEEEVTEIIYTIASVKKFEDMLVSLSRDPRQNVQILRAKEGQIEGFSIRANLLIARDFFRSFVPGGAASFHP